MAATTNYDFIGKRRICGAVSAVLVLLSLALAVVPGPKYGIDFAGGTNIIVRFHEAVPDAEVRAAVGALGVEAPGVVRFGAPDDFEFLVQTRSVSSITDEMEVALTAALVAELGDETVVEHDDESGDVLYVVVPSAVYEGGAEGSEADAAFFASSEEAIATRIVTAAAAGGLGGATAEIFGNPVARRFALRVQTLQATVSEGLSQAFGAKFAAIERVETVGARVGAQLRNDAIQAILFALVGILLYIAFRFDLRYAPGAVIALAHDVAITLGCFVVLRQEISLPILAAFLTIVGYSLNDTIVNFDRIRENLDRAEGKVDLYALVNRSINEVLSRTILTSGTTLIAILAIYFLGGGLVKPFALAMFIGVTVGTYSSVYIANPLMIWASNLLDARTAQAKARAPSPAATGPLSGP